MNYAYEIDEILRENPEYASLLYSIKSKIHKGFFKQEYLDIIFQLDNRFGMLKIEDVYYFSKIHADLLLGKIVKMEFEINETPFPNKEIEENNRALKNLPDFVEAEFSPTCGATYNDDGYLQINKPIIFEQTLINEKKDAYKKIIKLENIVFPLEVGTTKAETTFSHLYVDGRSLARWPYDSKNVTLLYKINNEEDVDKKLVTYKEYINEMNNGKELSDTLGFTGEIVFKDGTYKFDSEKKKYIKKQKD